MSSPVSPCPGPLTRRSFLKIGAMTLGVPGVRGLLPLRLTAAETGRPVTDTSVILLWLPGGPPHMETYDMKPDAPVEYRGDFRPIKTVVPGIDVCELLPLHARSAHRFALIRSIAHTFADHGGGHKRFLTGRDPLQPTEFVNDYPMVGSMVARVRAGRHNDVPTYVAGTDPGRAGIDVYSFGSAYLGPSTHPFTVVGDPSSPQFAVRNLTATAQAQTRMAERAQLLGRLDKVPPRLDRSGTMLAIDAYRERALGLLTTDTARKAFDLSREPEAAQALRNARLGPAGADGPAPGRARRQLRDDGHGEPVSVGRPLSQGRHLQLGLTCGQLPSVQRRPPAAAALRPGGEPPWLRICTIAGWTEKCC